jgi:putative DNA primase/helicase
MKEHYTDLGNARRLVQRHGADLRHCAETGRWYVWDGKRWAPDATEEVMRRAKDTVRAMYREAARELERASDIVDDAQRKAAVQAAKRAQAHAVASEHRSRLEAMPRLTESEVAITLGQLDEEPWLLNCQNGTIDLRTGKLQPHDRTDLITRITPVEHDPSAVDLRWSQFLDQVMPNPDIRSYVQRGLGYSTTGSGLEGNMFLAGGPTHTGKTTLLEAVKASLGSYAITMDVETLTGSNRHRDGGRPRFDILRLFGARLVVSTEVPAGVKLDEALVKKFTGGDSLLARGLYARDGQESSGTFVIWLGSNYRPMVRDDDDAVWERVRQVPFTEQHIGEAKDKTLRPYLMTEARAAVLAWLVEGARLYQEEGLEAPPAVVSLTEDYRRDMNPLTTWIGECCDLGPTYETTYHDLRWSYEEFTRRGDRPVGSKRFTNSLAMVPGVSFDKDRRVWLGIRVARGE